ncbi:winged helix-turn-helix domain-containing protein [Streptomyces sp. NPDC016845]|uniref:winged helix-turn-helix domain-containing protein n=1 Tax=Streptomyces sp. NPDC016845 TaxID=3364972 RepID=UPI0037A7C03F
MTRTSKQLKRSGKKSKKKGRRHRTVNRTPRPVGSSGPAGQSHAAPPTPTKSSPTPDSERRQAPAVPAPATEAQHDGERGRGDAEVVAKLNRTTHTTWSWLQQAAPERAWTVEEVSEAVGFTPRTVSRHLQTLATHGLAGQDADGAWRTTTPVAVP